ncbi:hypothetical protein MPSEU_000545300 [Mayamaea pseudoterrestris]|nr:hypothetical protein MPSEU_000545300 [Mayamaea pseudoterrestris]
MEAIVIALAGLTDEYVAALAAGGIISKDDLGIVSRLDITEALPQAPVMVRRKLELIGDYVFRGQELTVETTIPSIREYLSNQGNPQQPAGAPAAAAVAAAPKNNLRITVNPLDPFSGAIMDWERWEIKARDTINQSLYSTLLTTEPSGNANAQTASREFYSMLSRAVADGDAYHIVEGVENQDGFIAWKKLVDWYTSPVTGRSLVQFHRKKLQDARLDEDCTASSYINTFMTSSRKLDSLNAGLTDSIKLQDFLEGIVDEDYDVVVQGMKRQVGLTFDDAVKAIRGREQDLVDKANATGTHTPSTKARRAPGGANNNGSRNTIPFIPNFLLNTIKQDHIRKNLLKWRAIRNDEGREIRPDKLIPDPDAGGHQGGDNNDRATQGSNKSHTATPKSARKSGKRGLKSRRVATVSAPSVKARQTKTKLTGLGDSALKVFLKDEDEHAEDSCSDDEDDGVNEQADQNESSVSKSLRRRKKATKKLATKTRRNPRSRRGRSADRPRAIIDPGSEINIIGGVGWEVIAAVNMSARVDGALTGMEGKRLPIVCQHRRS